MGEIVIVAVDPSHQRQGLATALTEAATAWLRDQGARDHRDGRDRR
jgi:GNAT superfamily N-acetyltransferase